MKNPEREKNLERIRLLHRALRYTGCGECPPGFEHLKLIQVARELRARIEVETFCVKMDEPAYFMELVKDGKQAAYKKVADIVENDAMTLMEKGKEMVRDICKKESRPDKHELN